MYPEVRTSSCYRSQNMVFYIFHCGRVRYEISNHIYNNNKEKHIKNSAVNAFKICINEYTITLEKIEKLPIDYKLHLIESIVT